MKGGAKMEQKIFSTDEIVLLAIKEKHSFESHKNDIPYADHHKKSWIHVDLKELRTKHNKGTLTLSQLKKIVDKQLKVK